MACSPSVSPVDRTAGDGALAPDAGRELATDLHAPGTALALLASLSVQPHAPADGYTRERFGPAWADADRNGCDTRNDILRRDLGDVTVKPGTRDCVVLAGTLADPYTGTKIRFERGGASEVDVDHVVALRDAWLTGAAAWPYRQRIALANDPLNLLAAQAASNRSKGAGDAASWLPANAAFRCDYVARQVAVKAKYRLWVTPPEREAMARVLAACPGILAPVGDAPILAPIEPAEPAAPAAPAADAGHARTRPPTTPTRTEPAHERARPPTTPTRTEPAAATADPNYGTCKQAKANHAGPYVRGRDPEYAYYRDADGDGVVCE